MKLVQHPNVVRLYEVSGPLAFSKSRKVDCVANLIKCNQSNQVQGIRNPINCRKKILHLWRLKGALRYPSKSAKRFNPVLHMSLQHSFFDVQCTLFSEQRFKYSGNFWTTMGVWKMFRISHFATCRWLTPRRSYTWFWSWVMGVTCTITSWSTKAGWRKIGLGNIFVRWLDSSAFWFEI